ncbi:MAG: glutathione synthase [Alphaproteobacteria bacterium]|nr:glutathione synthase [Alphaproteobacteria bacterium]
MPRKIALQIDPLESLHRFRDTSLLLGLEAQKRGDSIYYYEPNDLSFQTGVVQSPLKSLELTLSDEGFSYQVGSPIVTDLREMDVILLRQNPPFDMSYLTTTYLLDQIADQTLVLNNPTGVRNHVEKLLPLEFPSLTPPTLISSDWEAIVAFCEQHPEVILKPLLDFGGNSVFHIHSQQGQLKSLYQLMKRSYPGLPFILQPFIPEVLTGDKRLILIDGELIGGFKRVPLKGEVRSNQLMGGLVKAYDISDKDREICQILGPRLRELGLFFVGIDVIGEYLIEINVTSPTGLHPLQELTGIQGPVLFWDRVEKIIGNNKNGSQYYNRSLSRY